ncbi:MAG: glycine betaine ABC transporter substrate-binding protein [Actinomycetota bacterium]|nr:glycine betaine ABC transporter substrate-binding protein [Actinomycetota bacterium]MDQ3641674.1 glycine betaine ABC transporter substrate-binding protein [Actinomycetota bacterium]
MTATRTRLARLVALLAALTVLAAACGGGEEESGGDGGGDALAETLDLGDAQVGVGSKEFTEQLVVGNIAAMALEAAGAEVDNQVGIIGTNVVRQALESGEIDMYWEYTGTGWITILGNTEPIADEREQYLAVAEEDLDENGIIWLEPAPMNNTYALAAGPDAAEGLGVETLSDVAELDEEELTLCADAEFLSRDDGLPGLEEHYDFDWPEDGITELDLGIIYAATGAGDQCNFGEVFATDGRIQAQDLTVMEDDQNFFPKYNLSMTMQEETYQEHDVDYDELFSTISSALTNETMTDMNAQVDVEGEDPEDVAEQFLIDNDIISG